MVNKLLIVYCVLDVLFLASGILMIAFALVSEMRINQTPTIDTIAQSVLLGQCPLTAALVNAVFIFIAFLTSIPALTMKKNKGWLRCQGWITVFCALFTLVLGLVLWFDTLRTRSNLLQVWSNQPALGQDLLQQKFNCCGYLSSTQPPFVKDRTCPNALAAAQKQGCISPFSNFANQYLDVIFTASFGIVAIEVLLILTTAMVVKDRQEKERYRLIDAKQGSGGI